MAQDDPKTEDEPKNDYDLEKEDYHKDKDDLKSENHPKKSKALFDGILARIFG